MFVPDQLCDFNALFMPSVKKKSFMPMYSAAIFSFFSFTWFLFIKSCIFKEKWLIVSLQSTTLFELILIIVIYN